jgi:hypothetical protein
MLDHIIYLITMGFVLSDCIAVELNNEISEFQWESYLKECTDIDIMSLSFTQKYLEIISRNIPSKMIRVRPSDKPWFNSHIKREIVPETD